MKRVTGRIEGGGQQFIVMSPKDIMKDAAGSTEDTGPKPMRPSLFTQKDYDSNSGMLTDIWGACQWHVLHTMSFNYPTKPSSDQKRWYRAHVDNLVNVLPCGKCRKNLVANFRKLPLLQKHMESRATFSRYIYDLHELVNAMLHKPSGLSYEQVRDRYEQFRSRCTLTPNEKQAPTPVHDPKKPESGCTEPLIGEKQKCVLNIVPKTKKCSTFKIDRACVRSRRVSAFSPFPST